MKFYVSMAIAAVLLTATVNAQHINVGIKGGLNVYNINNDNGTEYDAKTGFHLGLLGHIHLARQIALQPEIMYSAQGAKYTVSSNDTKINLGYINVPVLVQYMFDNGFRLQAGPQVGFLANAKTKTGDVSVDIKDSFEKVDFALSFGGGYVKPSTGLGIDIRYNLGLSDISKNNSVKSTNRGVQIGLFYLLNHK